VEEGTSWVSRVVFGAAGNDKGDGDGDCLGSELRS
jgi:hypothetical protein